MPDIKSLKAALSAIETDKSKILTLKVGPHDNVTPGQKIPRADAQSPPTLSFPGAAPGKTYMVIGLDIDAPFPSFDVLGPILHWVQPGLTASGRTGALEATEPFVANYIGPAPPPGSSPHRYVFLLYEQPTGFDGKKYAPPDGKDLSNWNRMRYDLGRFEKEIKLGSVVAVNYFYSN